jgi:hypothetical protein
MECVYDCSRFSAVRQPQGVTGRLWPFDDKIIQKYMQLAATGSSDTKRHTLFRRPGPRGRIVGRYG